MRGDRRFRYPERTCGFEDLGATILEEPCGGEIVGVIRVRDTNGRKTPGVLQLRIERDVVRLDREGRAVTGNLHAAGKFLQACLERLAPRRPVGGGADRPRR